MAVKTTKALQWQTLKEEFVIGKIRVGKKFFDVNQLADAIKDGEILARLQECADTLHNGDFNEAIKAYRRTLSSQACNMKKSELTTGTDLLRYNLLNDYTATFVVKSTNNVVIGKAKHDYTMEDIKKFAGDYKELTNLYNSFSTQKSRYAEKIEDMADFTARFDYVKQLKKAAKVKAYVSVDIIEKVKAGGTLTAEELTQVLKALGR